MITDKANKDNEGKDSRGAESSRESKATQRDAYDITLSPNMTGKHELDCVLFPGGVDFTHEQRQDLLEYYRLAMQNSEQLATRRQNLNSFFLSINSMLMAGVGVIAKEVISQISVPPSHHRNPVVGESSLVIMLCITGLIICRNWEALIKSYARLVQANSVVMEAMEKHLLAAMTTAQQRIHGTDYMSMAKVESRIATAFMVLYTIILIAVSYMVFCLKTNAGDMHMPPDQVAPIQQLPSMQSEPESASAIRRVTSEAEH